MKFATQILPRIIFFNTPLLQCKKHSKIQPSFLAFPLNMADAKSTPMLFPRTYIYRYYNVFVGPKLKNRGLWQWGHTKKV